MRIGGGAKCEARRAEAGGATGQEPGYGSCGGGLLPPPHQQGSLGECCMLPSGVRGRTPAAR